MTTSRGHGEAELSPDEITVANLIDDIGRDAATLRFLLKERGSPISIKVQSVLDALDQQGLATPNAKGLYRLTEEGRARLRSGQDWVFEVVETFQVSFADKPLLLGRLQRGTVRAKDWFRSSTGIVGHVEGVEFIHGRDIPIDQFVLRVDRDGITPGETLARTELRAGS